MLLGPIPQPVANLTQLETLNLADYQFVGEISEQMIPLYSKYNLKSLYLSNNRFDKLWRSIYQMIDLTQFNIFWVWDLNGLVMSSSVLPS